MLAYHTILYYPDLQSEALCLSNKQQNKTKKQTKIIVLLLDYTISLKYKIHHMLFVCALECQKPIKIFLTFNLSIAEDL